MPSIIDQLRDEEAASEFAARFAIHVDPPEADGPCGCRLAYVAGVLALDESACLTHEQP